VLVVERSSQAGGACITQELLPGFRFSTFAYSAHGPGPKICSDLQIPEDAFPMVTPDPALVQLFPDRSRLVLWHDADLTKSELARFSLHDANSYEAYQDFCRRAVKICGDFLFEDPPDPLDIRRRWTRQEDSEVLDILFKGSLWDAICSHFEHEKVRMAFARADDAGPTNYPGSALAEFVESASSGLGIRNQSGLLRGGMGRITEILAQRVAAYGGTIRLNAPVRRVLVERGRASGVELESGEQMGAAAVVSNADPKRTYLTLVGPEHCDPGFRAAITNLKTNASYMKFLAVLSEPPRFSALSNNERDDPRFAAAARILPSLSYLEESWQDCLHGRLPQNPVLSLQLPTAYWPSQAPPGKHTFGAWVRWAPSRLADGSSWDARREEMADRLVMILESYAPGFASTVQWRRLYTPTDIERETGITDASIRHLDMTLDQMLNRRPLLGWCRYQTPIEGLWLCGSGTHPCGSVTGVPGHNCAAAFLRYNANVSRR
jgi:phytoene dehydrogenase-like protein